MKRLPSYGILLLALAFMLAACGNNENGREPEAEETQRLAETMQAVSTDTTFAALETLAGHSPATTNLFERQPLSRLLDEVLKDDKGRLKSILYGTEKIQKDSVLYLWNEVPEDMGGGFAYLLIDTKAGKAMGGVITAEKKVKLMKNGLTVYQPDEIRQKCVELGWDGY